MTYRPPDWQQMAREIINQEARLHNNKEYDEELYQINREREEDNGQRNSCEAKYISS